jgi:predicted nucleic acid-binding protein
MASHIIVDTNVLIDVVQNDATWADWSIGQLRAQSKLRTLAINPVIYAEFSLAFSGIELVEQAVAELGLAVLPLSKPALFLAARAFLHYKRTGGSKSNVLPDFFIGAQAATENLPILTRDVRRYSTYFPTVKLISPAAQ